MTSSRMTLTPPESRTERDLGWRTVDRVRDCGGCGACLNRDRDSMAFGRALCGLKPARTFPACVDQTPGFLPDPAVLYGKDAVE